MFKYTSITVLTPRDIEAINRSISIPLSTFDALRLKRTNTATAPQQPIQTAKEEMIICAGGLDKSINDKIKAKSARKSVKLCFISQNILAKVTAEQVLALGHTFAGKR
jgi:hypothetical protein